MNVCFWHKAGMLTAARNIRESGHGDCSAKFLLMNQSGRRSCFQRLRRNTVEQMPRLWLEITRPIRPVVLSSNQITKPSAGTTTFRAFAN
jgi:hypothetical protein